VYRHATMVGRAIGRPAAVGPASRPNSACVQALCG
jgi:hypothetical protein